MTTADQIDRFMDTSSDEELDPELEAYLSVTDDGWTMIRHPLVYSMMHMPALNKLVNAQLQAKIDGIAKAELEGKFSTIIWLHERPHRLPAFEEWGHHFRPHAYWKTLGEVLTDTENMHQEYSTWRRLLTADVPHRWAMMDRAERAMLRALGRRPIMVHRGYNRAGYEDGFSWTLSLERAEWFAQRYASLGQFAKVTTGLIDRRDVIAYMGSRNEEEIVALPEHVHRIRTEEV